jgi:hypothetical protein
MYVGLSGCLAIQRCALRDPKFEFFDRKKLSFFPAAAATGRKFNPQFQRHTEF